MRSYVLIRMGRHWQRWSQKRLFKTPSTVKGLATGASSFAPASVKRRPKKTSAGDGFSNRDTVQDCALDKWSGPWEAAEDRSVVVIDQPPRDFPECNFATGTLGAGTRMSPVSGMAYESLGPSTSRNFLDAHDVAGRSLHCLDPSMPRSALGSDLDPVGTDMASLSRLVAGSASESEESTDMDANWFNDALSDTSMLAMHHQHDLAASETEDGGDEASCYSSDY